MSSNTRSSRHVEPAYPTRLTRPTCPTRPTSPCEHGIGPLAVPVHGSNDKTGLSDELAKFCLRQKPRIPHPHREHRVTPPGGAPAQRREPSAARWRVAVRGAEEEAHEDGAVRKRRDLLQCAYSLPVAREVREARPSENRRFKPWEPP